MLGDLDAGVEGFCGVIGQDGDATLTKDGAGIDSGIHKMDGAAGFWNACFESLTPGGKTAKCGE